jgi:hypothetical protein
MAVVQGDIARVPLTKGYEAIIDAADVALLPPTAWEATLLHRLIMGFGPSDPRVDHIDGDGLNNRRSNLREATQGQNNANQRPQVGKSSRYKGVSWFKPAKMWRAYIKVGGVISWLGYFHDEKEAAKAYDEAAVEAWGEFARPNFPMAT